MNKKQSDLANLVRQAKQRADELGTRAAAFAFQSLADHYGRDETARLLADRVNGEEGDVQDPIDQTNPRHRRATSMSGLSGNVQEGRVNRQWLVQQSADEVTIPEQADLIYLDPPFASGKTRTQGDHPNTQGRAGFHPDGRMLTDVWQLPIISTTSHERVGYPTQKPLKLLTRIVALFTNPGDLVVDPFMGSGTTGVAALQLGRRFFGADVSTAALQVTQERLGKENQ